MTLEVEHLTIRQIGWRNSDFSVLATYSYKNSNDRIPAPLNEDAGTSENLAIKKVKRSGNDHLGYLLKFWRDVLT